jgi:hypothetical protein
MNAPPTSQAALAPAASQGSIHSFAFTFIAAATAAVAAFASVSLDFPVWVMFVGWVGYSSRVGTWRGNVANYTCLVLGVLLGIGAALALPPLQPFAGAAALPIVVFAVATIVISMRTAPAVNNLTCYFLGLIAFFAADPPPTLASLVYLASAMGLGCIAASISAWLQARA